jgi:hypothetical protein
MLNMESLRDLLGIKNNELITAFIESLKYLNISIFPLLGSNGESLNSLPHLVNNENYLNGILPPIEDLFDEKFPLFISPYELYSILSAIYLHDIGRISCKEGHGAESKKKIDSLWKELKIPSKELADAIGDICNIHEPIEKGKQMNPKVDVLIDNCKLLIKPSGQIEINEINYMPVSSNKMLDNNAGFVRVNELGALLSLVDNMDSTYRRLARLEVLDKDNYTSSLAIFRDCIKGVSYNKESQAIFVTLNFKKTASINIEKAGDIGPLQNKISEYAKKMGLKTFEDFILDRTDKEKNFLFSEINDSKSVDINPDIYLIEWLLINGVYVNDFWGRLNSFKVKDIRKLFREAKKKSDLEITKIIQIYDNKIFLNLDQYFKNKKQIDQKIKKDYKNIFADFKGFIYQGFNEIRMPQEVIIPMILGNIRACHFNMEQKYKYLSRFGIPLKCWLIYIDEHLYNYLGEETFEPVFSEGFLKHIVKTMWTLSTRVFGQSFFTYEKLASAAGEKDLNLIKLAVKRIEIISRNEKLHLGLTSAINYNTNGWQWEIQEEMNTGKCLFYSNKDLDEIIEKLGKPLVTK